MVALPAQLVTRGGEAKLLILLERDGSSERIGKPDSALYVRGDAPYLATGFGLLFLGAALREVPSCSVNSVQTVQISPKPIAKTGPGFRAVTDTSDEGRHNSLNRDRIDRPQGPDNRQLIFRFVALAQEAATGYSEIELILIPNLTREKEVVGNTSPYRNLP